LMYKVSMKPLNNGYCAKNIWLHVLTFPHHCAVQSITYKIPKLFDTEVLNCHNHRLLKAYQIYRFAESENCA
jgi:hypothetical protein